MAPDGIVEAVNVAANGLRRLLAGVEDGPPHQLGFLWSLDLSHRKTRPRHPQSDEKAQQAFKKGALLPA